MTDDLADIDLRQNVKQRATWIRLIYMLVLAVIWQVSEIVMWLIVILQFLIKLVSGKPLDSLTDFGGKLATYMAQIVRFETFVTEDIPFPFSPWPSGSGGSEVPVPAAVPAAEEGAAEPKPPARRSPRRSTAKKATKSAAPKDDGQNKT